MIKSNVLLLIKRFKKYQKNSIRNIHVAHSVRPFVMAALGLMLWELNT